MTANYRLVHYVPDPFTGGRVAIGALVRSDNGITVALDDTLDIGPCFGPPARRANVRMVIQTIQRASDFNILPVGAGPQAVLDEVRELPSGVENPVEWIQHHILRRREKATRETRRDTAGTRYVESKRVDRWVHRRFDPSHKWRRTRGTIPLESITQWVGNAESHIMLLEPILPTRRTLADDVVEVGTRLGAYQHMMNKLHPVKDAALIAYVLPGGNPNARRDAIEDLRTTATVVDTEDAVAEKEFLDQIREIGLYEAAP